MLLFWIIVIYFKLKPVRIIIYITSCKNTKESKRWLGEIKFVISKSLDAKIFQEIRQAVTR